jgi:hypothetical protein
LALLASTLYGDDAAILDSLTFENSMQLEKATTFREEVGDEKTPAISPTGVYMAQFLLPVSGRPDLLACEVDTSVKPRLRVSRSSDLLHAAPPPAREEGLRLATKSSPNPCAATVVS